MGLLIEGASMFVALIFLTIIVGISAYSIVTHTASVLSYCTVFVASPFIVLAFVRLVRGDK